MRTMTTRATTTRDHSDNDHDHDDTITMATIMTARTHARHARTHIAPAVHRYARHGTARAPAQRSTSTSTTSTAQHHEHHDDLDHTTFCCNSCI